MKNSFRLSLRLLYLPVAMTAVTSAASAQPTKPATSTGAKAPLSVEDKVKAEFTEWRYAGAKITASFQRGPISLLSITTPDSMEKVWKHYMTLVPTGNNIPLTQTWETPDDNTVIGANYKLGSSYAISLNSAPREGGTIVYQKGTVNVVIEVRARTPEQAKATGIGTDIKLIKMKPLDAPKPGQSTDNPMQGATTPPAIW